VPDISMCAATKCPLSKDCYRHADSGTKPNEPWQTYSYFLHGVSGCDRFWRAKPKDPDHVRPSVGEGWADQSVDIGSECGPEPTIRKIVLHYYTSHGVPPDKAEAWTAQYIAAAPSPPIGQDRGGWRPMSELPERAYVVIARPLPNGQWSSFTAAVVPGEYDWPAGAMFMELVFPGRSALTKGEADA